MVDDFGALGITEEEKKAMVALNGQLLHTQLMIKTTLTEHPHYTDDCGEYLRSALELSYRLMSARENSIEDLIARLKELGEVQQPAEVFGGEIRLFSDYASDGIAPQIFEYLGIAL